MKTKTIAFLVIAAIVMSAAVGMAVAKKDGQAGKSNVAHLYLYEKIPSGEWPIVDDGAWGKLKYNLVGPEFDFVFNGHGLEPNTGYTLIYYADPWPGTGGCDIASGTSNEGGNIHLADSADIGTIPVVADTNDGAKIWLVLSDDYNADTDRMSGWNPAEYLFENNLITYTK
jgi:hypothetical protein